MKRCRAFTLTAVPVTGLVNNTGVGWTALSTNGFGFVPGQSSRYDWPSKSSSGLKQPSILTTAESVPGTQRCARSANIA